MRIATVLFTYNRSRHTNEVLEALRVNTVLPEKLIIFQDGRKAYEDFSEWENVNKVINNVAWCDCEVHVSNKNKGVDRTEVEALDAIFYEYDAAIILEDDCVPHPLFMEYMIAGIEKYKNNPRVFSISGSTHINYESNDNVDCYWGQRMSSWGWATWADRWDNYEQNHRLLKRIFENEEMAERLLIWGNDLEDNVSIGAWDAYWALKAIEMDGVCLFPKESLINNIGFDGTGVHCGVSKIDLLVRGKDNLMKIELPDTIKIYDKVKKCYSEKYRGSKYYIELKEKRTKYYLETMKNWIRIKQNNDSINKYFEENHISEVSIWGINDYTDLLINEIQEYVSINSFILTKKQYESYKEVTVIEPNQVDKNVKLIIVIPGWDMDNIKGMVAVETREKLIGINEFLMSCMR